MGKKEKDTEISRTELSAQINAELEKAIDDLTLFDDDLMISRRTLVTLVVSKAAFLIIQPENPCL